MVMQDAIRALIDRGDLRPEEAAAALEFIMTGQASDAQIAAFLAALRVRGETAKVVAACLEVMQAHAEPVPVEDVIDLCGTGGDGMDTFNVSTAAGFVVAATGVRVAKHGNRAMSSKCGSADLLEALGARTDLNGEQAARAIDECGFGFLFAQRFHPAMKHVAAARREMGVRTIFNILGPLSNPARPRGQLVGVGAAWIGPLVAEALALRGMRSAMVVHSANGLDEISPEGPTHAWIVREGSVTEEELRPADFGLPEHPLESVLGSDPEANARTLRTVFAGGDGAVADFVVMNAAAACFMAGAVDSLKDGARLCKEAIASGRAGKVLDRYVALTHEVAGG